MELVNGWVRDDSGWRSSYFYERGAYRARIIVESYPRGSPVMTSSVEWRVNDYSFIVVYSGSYRFGSRFQALGFLCGEMSHLERVILANEVFRGE